MVNGSCLCGGIKFQVIKISRPMEICHCNRCRKKSGAGSITTVEVLSTDFTFIRGKELIRSYTAPLLYSGPAYQSHFCTQCGSPVPSPNCHETHIEIPAGLFNDDPQVRADKHIFVEYVAPWDTISDDLPQFKIRELVRERYNRELPDDFELKSHYDTT